MLDHEYLVSILEPNFQSSDKYDIKSASLHFFPKKKNLKIINFTNIKICF